MSASTSEAITLIPTELEGEKKKKGGIRCKCCVLGCPVNQSPSRRNRLGYSEDIRFYRFPTDEER